MRLRYLQTEQGAEAYSVLVQDIPGVTYGTPLHRLDNTVLAVLPNAVKDPVKHAIGKVVSVGEKGVSATASKLANTLVSNRRALGTERGLGELGHCRGVLTESLGALRQQMAETYW